VWAYRRDGVWALAPDARAQELVRSRSAFRSTKSEKQVGEIWAGSSQGHYDADTPSRPHADTRFLLAPGFWLLAPY